MKRQTTTPSSSGLSERKTVNRIGQAGGGGRDEGFAARLAVALDGRTKTWLAEKTGLSTSTIGDYANGAMPSADRAFLIADVLRVDARWLVMGEKDPAKVVVEKAATYFPDDKIPRRMGFREVLDEITKKP
jgi:hypothetical protein